MEWWKPSSKMLNYNPNYSCLAPSKIPAPTLSADAKSTPPLTSARRDIRAQVLSPYSKSIPFGLIKKERSSKPNQPLGRSIYYQSTRSGRYTSNTNKPIPFIARLYLCSCYTYPKTTTDHDPRAAGPAVRRHVPLVPAPRFAQSIKIQRYAFLTDVPALCSNPPHSGCV